MSQISTLELAQYLKEHSIEQADLIAAERLTNLHYLVKDLSFALGVAVCYVEDAQHDESYKPERVSKQLESMKSVLKRTEAQND